MTEKDPTEIKLTKLQYYRTEIQHEYTLLYSRVSTYVTSQSFLTIAFASAMGSRNVARWSESFSFWFPLLLSLIGIFTSLTIRGGVKAAIDTIALWHINQNKLFENDPAMEDFEVHAPLAKSQSPLDAKHKRILEYAQIMPRMFLVAWCVFGALDIYLHIK
jgi:hypothetical protein